MPGQQLSGDMLCLSQHPTQSLLIPLLMVSPLIVTAERWCWDSLHKWSLPTIMEVVLPFMMEEHYLNTLRPRQNGRHFTDDTFKSIFLNENARILIEISLKFVPKGPINNNPALVQIMAWRHPGDKPLSEPMMVSVPTHICITRPQWNKNACKE